MPVCQYARTYLAARAALKAAGVGRVLFGEWSPNNTLAWRHALAVARHRLSEIVAWDLRARPGGKWDSSLIDVAGRPRPAFGLIAGR
jgi:hypothetical protein